MKQVLIGYATNVNGGKELEDQVTALSENKCNLVIVNTKPDNSQLEYVYEYAKAQVNGKQKVIIIAASFDVISPNAKVRAAIIEKFDAIGISIRFLKEHVETGNAIGRMRAEGLDTSGMYRVNALSFPPKKQARR